MTVALSTSTFTKATPAPLETQPDLILAKGDRIWVRASRSDRNSRVTYVKDGHNITAAMVRGVRIPLLAGEAARITARVQDTAHTKGRSVRKAVRVKAISSLNRTKEDNAIALVYKKKNRS